MLTFALSHPTLKHLKNYIYSSHTQNPTNSYHVCLYRHAVRNDHLSHEFCNSLLIVLSSSLLTHSLTPLLTLQSILPTEARGIQHPNPHTPLAVPQFHPFSLPCSASLFCSFWCSPNALSMLSLPGLSPHFLHLSICAPRYLHASVSHLLWVLLTSFVMPSLDSPFKMARHSHTSIICSFPPLQFSIEPTTIWHNTRLIVFLLYFFLC